MGDNRRDDADQIDIIATDERAPIIFNVIDAKFAGNFFSPIAMRAGNRDDPRVLAVLEPGNLRRAREAGADNADANCLCDGQPFRFLPSTYCLLPTAHCPLLLTAYCLLLTACGAPAGIRTPNQQIMSLLL